MRRLQRLVSAAILVALSGALTGCGSVGGFDPTDLLDFLDTKKKLPGDRKPVFPEGVPGLQQGVPRELYRGSAAEQQQQQDSAISPAPAAEPKESRSRGGKSRVTRNKPAVVSTSPDPAPAADPDAAPVEEGGTAAAPPAPKKKIVRRRTTAPPPDQAAPAPQQAQPSQPQSTQPGASPFPAPMPAGTFQR